MNKVDMSDIYNRKMPIVAIMANTRPGIDFFAVYSG